MRWQRLRARATMPRGRSLPRLRAGRRPPKRLHGVADPVLLRQRRAHRPEPPHVPFERVQLFRGRQLAPAGNVFAHQRVNHPAGLHVALHEIENVESLGIDLMVHALLYEK